MYNKFTSKQIKNFGKNCTVSLSSNMASMNFAQMNDFYERIDSLFNSPKKERKSKKQA